MRALPQADAWPPGPAGPRVQIRALESTRSTCVSGVGEALDPPSSSQRHGLQHRTESTGTFQKGSDLMTAETNKRSNKHDHRQACSRAAGGYSRSGP
ncbi:hypothetical protein GN956_G3470 [Arapaima gigas]